MRILKTGPLLLLCLIALSSIAYAGQLALTAKASIYNPPEACAAPSLMYGFGLDYDINGYWHAMADASYTSYAAGGKNYTLMPITVNLIGHFAPGAPVDPYLGGGLGYYSKTVDGVENGRTGAQAMTGIAFKIGNFNAALEATYMVTDLNDPSTASVSWGGWASGTAYAWIPF